MHPNPGAKPHRPIPQTNTPDNMQQVTHEGIVVSSQQGLVQVQMQVVSACHTCEAHARCTFAEKKDKTVDINTPQWQSYAPGDRVTVIINSGHGLLAVLIAYILPAILILATFATLYALRLPELWVAIASLAVIGIYTAALYLFRNRLQRKFTFRLEKAQ